jgi:tetratricopeptide (TPR) repeat protein
MFRRSMLLLVLMLAPASITPALGQAGRPSEAQACFDQRLDQPADLQNRMAACSRVIGEASQSTDKRAEAYLRRAFAYAQRADQSKSKEDVDRALADLSEGSHLAPNNAGVQKYALETRAGLQFRGGIYDRAVADYTALLALEPNSAPAYADRGLAFKALGRTSEAIADLRKAVSLDPSNAGIKEELRLAQAPPGTTQIATHSSTTPPATIREGANKDADPGQIELLKAEVREAQKAASAAEQRLAVLEAKVSAPAIQPSEPNPAVSPDLAKLARDLQSELKRVGCDPGPIDSQWGQKTQQALQKFAEQTKLALPSGEPTTAALDAVSAQQGRVCPLACADHQIEVGGRCAAKHAAPTRRDYGSYRRGRSQEQELSDRPSAGAPIGITIGVGRRGGINIGF